MQAVDELQRIHALVTAAEPWSPTYKKDKATHAQLIKTEAKLMTDLLAYFEKLAKQAPQFINWEAYHKKVVHAATATVLVEDGAIDDQASIIMSVVFQTVHEGTTAGAQAGQRIYDKIPAPTLQEAIQQAAMKLIARLVGKRVDENGHIVDNPDATYNILDSVRQDIRNSIAKSIDDSASQELASKRLEQIVGNPERSAMIARTETVNAYQSGLLAFGHASNATGKVWQSLNPDDICGENADEGEIDIHDTFGSGDDNPPAHPNCRCGMRLTYSEEDDTNSTDDDTEQ